MTEFNWDLAPEGADSLKQSVSEDDNLQWFRGQELYLGGGDYAHTLSPSDWQTVATRPATSEPCKTVEAYVKEQESEDWTHYVEDDEKQPTRCRKHLKLCAGVGWVYVCEKGDYFIPGKLGYCEVKPIKQKKLTRKEYDLLGGLAIHFGLNHEQFMDYLSQYDVTED